MLQRGLAKQNPNEPQRIPEGFLLTDQNNVWSWGKGLFNFLGVLIWCGISFPPFAGHLYRLLNAPSFSWGRLAVVLFFGLFVLSGVTMVVQGIQRTLVIAKLKPGEVILTTYPLLMGESCPVQFRRPLRSGMTPHPGKVSAQWRCYEWVQYQSGSDTETATHTLWETDLPEGPVSATARRVEYDAHLKVPQQGPPSIRAADNRVRWALVVTVDLPGLVKDVSFFEITILPEVLTG